MEQDSSIWGKILRINLSTGTSTIEEFDKKIWHQFLGGRGLGAYILSQEVDPNIDPLSEENKLIFMTGPLSGTIIPGNNKTCVTFKSPLTNTYSYSLCGGQWGPELKFAGYDGLIIEGKAERPVYIWINNDKIAINDAENIWGKLIPESDTLIRKELKGDLSIQIAVIGPAGENGIKYSCITSGFYREFGRGGSGAVMGSKNLKGIAIRGSMDVKYADVKKSMKLGEELAISLRKSPGGRIRRAYGTPELVEKFNENGMLCTENFSKGYSEGAKNFYAEKMREEIVIGDTSCYACPVGCGKITKINSKKYGEIIIEGPEFETIGLLGTNCGIFDWEPLVKATNICDVYGFDTMNAGVCVSLVMEGIQNNSIKDTENLLKDMKISFGDGESLIKLLELIGKREGIGRILGEGPLAAGLFLKNKELAIQSKGQGLAVYDPRGAKSMALTYATSPKGAHHMIATTMGVEVNSGNRLEYEGKGQLQREHQFSMCICDSIGICSTMRAGITLDEQVEAYNLLTGFNFTVDTIKKAAERIINLERLYNNKIGLQREDDGLPDRFTKESMDEGKTKAETVDLDRLLDDFYSLMGWNENGIPTKEKIQELSLTDIFE